MSAVFQGGVIMILSLVLFENEFLHIVSISFTSLILTELLMVALEITTWSVPLFQLFTLTCILYIFSPSLSTLTHFFCVWSVDCLGIGT